VWGDPESRAAAKPRHGRELAGADVVLELLALFLREVAGRHLRVDARDPRVLDRILELVPLDAEALRDVPEEVRGGIVRSVRRQRRAPAEHDHERRNGGDQPSSPIHRSSPLVRLPCGQRWQANLKAG
jgi:hypothetical protein